MATIVDPSILTPEQLRRLRDAIYAILEAGVLPGEIVEGELVEGEWLPEEGTADGADRTGYSTSALNSFLKAGFIAAATSIASKWADQLPAPVLSDLISGVAYTASSWVGDFTGRLISGITADQQQAIRDLTARALQDGLTTEELTAAVHGSVGLTSRYANAVMSYEQGLIDGGMDADRARQQALDYADTLRGSRADMIARTEIAAAYNQGKIATWKEAVAVGILAAGILKEWVAGEGACPECEELDGEQVGLDEVFSSGDDSPPAHPSCGCDISLANEDIQQPDDGIADQSTADDQSDQTTTDQASTGDLGGNQAQDIGQDMETV